MRILDCKSPICQEIVKGAPSTLDSLDDECRNHFGELQRRLTAMAIPFEVDPGIVRGLDYYTRTVFEFVCNDIGAQGTVCGGGRYDSLIEELGGAPTPAVGFAMGIGRLLLARQALQAAPAGSEPLDIFVGSMGARASVRAGELALQLRRAGYTAETDIMGRSVKAQMKYANKLGARYTAILGDDELDQNTIRLKNMQDGTVQEAALDDSEALDRLLQR